MLPSGQSSPGVRGFFHSQCEISHRLPDDPIVFPGKRGAAPTRTTSSATPPRALPRRTRRCSRRPPSAGARPIAPPTGCRPSTSSTRRSRPASRTSTTARDTATPGRSRRSRPGPRVIAGDAKASGVQQEHVALWRCDATAKRDPVSIPAVEVRRRRAVIRRRRTTVLRHSRAIDRLQSALLAAGGDDVGLRRAIARHQVAAWRDQRVIRRLRRGLNGSPGVPACPRNSMLRLTISFPTAGTEWTWTAPTPLPPRLLEGEEREKAGLPALPSRSGAAAHAQPPLHHARRPRHTARLGPGLHRARRFLQRLGPGHARRSGPSLPQTRRQLRRGVELRTPAA